MVAEAISIGVFRPRISARTFRSCAVPKVEGRANPCHGPEMLTSNFAEPSAAGRATVQAKNALQTKQVFQFCVAAQRKKITSTGNPSGSDNRLRSC